MAAGLGFKDFVTGEVLTAADVDGYLMQGIWVFASAAARSSAVTSPQEGNYSFLKDTNSTEYYDGAAWVAAGGGGGGKVLQVVQATYSTTVSSSSATYATTGLSCSITPSSATSKVLVLYSVAGVQKSNANLNTGMAMKLRRGATDIHLLGTDMLYTATAIVNYGTTAASSYLDSPATTSATTYEVFFANLNAVGSISVQVSGASSVSTMILLEIGA